MINSVALLRCTLSLASHTLFVLHFLVRLFQAYIHCCFQHGFAVVPRNLQLLLFNRFFRNLLSPPGTYKGRYVKSRLIGRSNSLVARACVPATLSPPKLGLLVEGQATGGPPKLPSTRPPKHHNFAVTVGDGRAPQLEEALSTIINAIKKIQLDHGLPDNLAAVKRSPADACQKSNAVRGPVTLRLYVPFDGGHILIGSSKSEIYLFVRTIPATPSGTKTPRRAPAPRGKGGGAKRGGGPTQGPGRVTKAPRASRNPKAIRDDGDGGEDDDDGNDDNKGSAHSKDVPDEDDTICFACPFLKWDGYYYFRCYRKFNMNRPVDVRQHLIRCHTQGAFYCPTCWENWTDKQAEKWQEHIRARSCQSREEPDYLSSEQVAALFRITGTAIKGRDGWYAIWDAILPPDQRPASPYVDTSIAGIAEFLADRPNRLMQALPALLNTVLPMEVVLNEEQTQHIVDEVHRLYILCSRPERPRPRPTSNEQMAVVGPQDQQENQQDQQRQHGQRNQQVHQGQQHQGQQHQGQQRQGQHQGQQNQQRQQNHQVLLVQHAQQQVQQVQNGQNGQHQENTHRYAGPPAPFFPQPPTQPLAQPPTQPLAQQPLQQPQQQPQPSLHLPRPFRPQYQGQQSPLYGGGDAMEAEDIFFSQPLQQQPVQPPFFLTDDAMDEDEFISQSQHQPGQPPLLGADATDTGYLELLNFDDDDDAGFDPALGSGQQPPPNGQH